MTEIKVCGMVCEEDITLVNETGPDYVGFVLYVPKSKRNLDIREARRLADRVRPGIMRVAVTVSPTKDQINEIQKGDFFDAVQIHGHFENELYEKISLPVIRAFNVTNLHEFEQWKRKKKIIGFVFDSKVPGSGSTFDWSLIKGLDRAGKKMFLAGGINESNVLEAIRQVRPDVIDLSSALEKADLEMPAGPESAEKAGGLKAPGAACGTGDGSCRRSLGKDPEKTKKTIRMVHNEE